MKRLLITLAAAFLTLSAFAQNNVPAGIRMEIVEIGENENQCSIFTYKDDDGTFGYYLSVGYSIPILEIFRDDDDEPSTSLGHFEETCIYMGATRDEAFATLDRFLALLDEEAGTTVEFPCRLSMGAERLGGSSRALCMVSKRLLQSKYLSFLFQSGGGSATAELTKSTIRSLRSALSFDKALHPNNK